MNTADILDAAADYIEVHGWRADGVIGPNGEACAVNAIYEIASIERGGLFAQVTLEHYLRNHEGLSADRGIGTWNDEQPDQYPVIDALRLCAKDIRNQAQPASGGDG